MRYFILIKYFLVLLSVTIAVPILANDRIPVNRYQTIIIETPLDSQDLLSVVVDVVFPDSVQQVGEALEILLHPNGFTIDAAVNDLNLFQYMLFNQTLPQVHRQFTAMTLSDVLTDLAGEAYSLVVNPVTRSVSFVLKDHYQSYISQTQAEAAEQQWRHHSAKRLRFGPVQQGDTLTRVASYLKSDQHTTDQKMVALYEANRHAFGDDNMHHLLVGAVLTLPTMDSLFDVTHTQAVAIRDDHYRAWTAKHTRMNAQ